MSLTTHNPTSFDAVLAPLATIGDLASIPSPTETASVLHVINGEHFSGAERVQQLLGKRLGEFWFRCEVCLCKAGSFSRAVRAEQEPSY